MANSIAAMNTVIDFWGLLLLLGRRAVEEFFKAFMFLFVLPNVSDETNNTRSSRRTTFSAWPEPARHETVTGMLSPEGLCLLLSRGDAGCNAELALHGTPIPMRCNPQEILKIGVEPGEDAASSPWKNREEHSTRGSD